MSRMIQYLSPLEYIQLRRAWPRFQKSLPTSLQFMERAFLAYIEKYLTPDQIRYVKFLLYENKGNYLSGGFLLNVLHGGIPLEEGQDIDIYFVPEDWLWEQNTPGIDGYDLINGIERVETQPNTKTPVQLISCRCLKTTLAGFDFSFCRNLFRPGEMLYIDDADGLTEQKCVVKLQDYIPKDYNGIINLDHRKHQLNIRLRKYYEKGYDITVDLRIDMSDSTGWPIEVPESYDIRREYHGRVWCLYAARNSGERCSFCEICLNLSDNLRTHIYRRWQESWSNGIYARYYNVIHPTF